ncbi:MAG TPA: hypothetical protein VN578_17600 [Candidatus Binatia bacterium]|nr:hypothetical protein [Candidatus Binatia bacterium]
MLRSSVPPTPAPERKALDTPAIRVDISGMDTTSTIPSGAPQVAEKDPALKSVAGTTVSIAGCALAAFVFGAIFDAAWPGAVAACGISAMGVGVAFFMLRRG